MRIAGGQAQNALIMAQIKFDEGALDDQFALSFFNPAAVGAFVVAEDCLPFHGYTENGNRPAEYIKGVCRH